MIEPLTLGESLRRRLFSRCGFLKFCAAMASLMALPQAMIPRIAEALEQARRSSVIRLSFATGTVVLSSFNADPSGLCSVCPVR